MGSKIGKVGHRYVSSLGADRRGYAVRVPLVGDSHRFVRKEFSAIALSLRELLKKAIAWRDAQYLAFHGHAIPKRSALHAKQSNNYATETAGARRQSKIIKKHVRGRTYTYRMDTYIAEVWLEPGIDGQRPRKSRSKVFSVAKYGEEEARDLAIMWRKEMERHLIEDGPKGFETWWKTVKGTPRDFHLRPGFRQRLYRFLRQFHPICLRTKWPWRAKYQICFARIRTAVMRIVTHLKI